MALIEIPQTPLWDTIPAGALTAADIMSLDDLVASDDFNTGTLDPALWDTDIVAGSGTASITEAGGEVDVATAVAASAGAILDYKTILNPRATNRWRLRAVIRGEDIQSNGSVIGAMLWQGATNPNVSDAASIQGAALCEIDIAGTTGGSNARIRYYSTGGVPTYWNGVQWTATPSDSFDLGLNESVGVEFEGDGTNLIIRVYDEAFAEVLLYATIPWASVRAEANDLYWLTGDPFNNAWYGAIKMKSFEHRGDYPTGQLATVGAIAVGGITIEQYPIITTGDVVGEYNVDGGGWVQPGAGGDAQMEAALVGLSPTTLDLRYTLDSDGLTDATIDINGGVLAGTGAVCDYPATDVVLEATVYDNGNLVGTLKKYGVDTDPNDTIRQQIIDTLETRFSTILTTNGYKTNLGNNVSRWKETQVPQGDLPHLAWRDDDEDETEATVGQIDHTLVIECRISTQTENELYAARADLIQAMGTDRTLGGLVGNTKPPEELGQADHGDQKVWTQSYRFVLEYPTDQFDEYNQ